MALIDLGTYQWNVVADAKQFNQSMQEIDKSMDNVEQKGNKLSTFLKVSLAGAFAGVAASIGKMVYDGIQGFADMEQSLSQFQATTGATGQEVEEIKNLAMDLYKTNTASMDEIVATATAMKQAMGLTTDEIKQTQQAFMDYAKVTGQGSADVVGAIDDIGDAWGLSLDEMVGALDMFKASSEKFGTDVAEIQSAMQQLAPASKALGLSFEETNGLLNAMAESGLDANSAVTALNYAAKQVKSPAEFKKMLEDIQKIEDPTKRTQKAVELFGARAGVAMANLLDGTKNLDDFIITMQEAQGTVTQASQAFDQNFNVQLELLKKQFSGVLIEIGGKLMPILNELMSWVSQHMPEISAFIDGVINVIGEAIRWVQANVLPLLQPVFQEIFNTLGVLKQTWEQIWSALQPYIMPILNGIIGAVQPFLSGIQDLFRAFSALLKGDWEGLWTSLQSMFGNLGEGIKSVVSGVFTSLGMILGNIWNGIKNTASNIWNGIKESVSAQMNALQMSISNIWNNILNAASTTWNNIKSAVIAQVDSLKLSVANIWNSIQTTASNVWNGIKNAVSTAVDSLRTGISNAFSSIKNITSTVWNEIREAILRPFIAAKNTIWDIINTIKDWFANLKLPEIKLPKIKLPHFRITGSFSLNPPSVPRISVEWYDKGGIFYEPTVIGVAEKRPEVVGALEDIRDLFRETLIDTIPRLEVPNTVAYTAAIPTTTLKTTQNVNQNVKFGDVNINIRVERVENQQQVENLARQVKQEVENIFATMSRKSGLSLGVNKGF